jgi:hypothetical protein
MEAMIKQSQMENRFMAVSDFGWIAKSNFRTGRKMGTENPGVAELRPPKDQEFAMAGCKHPSER